MSMSEANNTRPPENALDLAKWFNEAIVGEIQFLEKISREQNYELLYGQQTNSGKDFATYIFHLADGTRLPEDANGKLSYDTFIYIADIIRQDGNTIELKLSGSNLPPKIYRATLSIDDTALLKKLSEKLSKIENKETTITNCANLVFHPKNSTVSATEAYTPNLSTELRPEQADTIIRCCNSEITYVWGPPGTGKTHLITNLLAALLNKNERVLIASHTKKAVDQALYEAIKEDGGKKGVLAGQQIIAECRVLRLGVVGESTNNLPDNVVFDKALNNKTTAWNEQILILEKEINSLADKISCGKTNISEWVKIDEYGNKINQATNRLAETNKTIDKLLAEKVYGQKILNIAKVSLEKANKSWFYKKTKIESAQNNIVQAINSVEVAEEFLKKEHLDKDRHIKTITDITILRDTQAEKCKNLLPKAIYEKEVTNLSFFVNTKQDNINELKDKICAAASVLLNESRALFCTLTKCYMAKELENQEFDAVIIDEISMALPPLVFLAAGKAKKRIILVGDFKQLPPIIRSDSVIGNTRLKHDVFCLSGLVDSAGKVTELGHTVLCKLTRQSRMLKEIATVSRHLSYKKAGLNLEDELEKPENATENRKRREQTNTWLDFLPQSPLVVIDTSDLHLWCGKQINTLSRFNFYSSVIAVEIAKQALEKVTGNETIGIITPFAAQRKLLAKLVKEKELSRITVGTVHTFQGGEADLVIFDSVLDEPYWAARICTPQKENVDGGERDLNVAITRAKNKFVFVGSSNWLNKNARANSAMGEFWKHLTTHRHSTLVSVCDLLGKNVINSAFAEQGNLFQDGVTDKNYKIQRLDEKTFFEALFKDIQSAKKCIIGMCPFFGEYRWPKVEPYIRNAKARGVNIILITPPLKEVKNVFYVKEIIDNLQAIGVTVVASSGLHGKDIFIDDRIMYTGSMNWTSNRGLSEACHRIDNPDYVKLCADYLQHTTIEAALEPQNNLSPLICPDCKSTVYPLQLINQKQLSTWDKQPLKLGCTNPKCGKYMRKINDRKPFLYKPLCSEDGETKYHLIKFRNKDYWACPKHPKTCKKYPFVKGDCI